MTERRRVRWRATVVTRRVELAEVLYRQPGLLDCEALGSLMLDAYRGTLDERHRSSVEATDHVAKYFTGEFGEPLLDCSFVALENSRPIGVTLVSMDEEEPLLAQVYTAPEWKNRGLASALIQMSMNALAITGLTVLNLFATVGNHPAEHVYRKLGFEPLE